MFLVLRDIVIERARQEEKFPHQHLPFGTSTINVRLANATKAHVNQMAREGNLTWMDVLREEVDEASAEIDPRLFRAELIQVAAVAVRIIEDIDREYGGTH